MMIKIRTIGWENNAIKIIDQTKLPAKLVYLRIRDLPALWQAIKGLKVRGAPALGAAAALGVYLGVKDVPEGNPGRLLRELEKVIRYLASARPTARNLFWGLERMRRVAVENREKPAAEIKKLLFYEKDFANSRNLSSCRFC